MIYRLAYPVEVAGRTISELTLTPKARAFKGFKMRAAADGSTDWEPYAAAEVAIRMAGESTPVLDALHPYDVSELGKLAMSFFASGPLTGKTA